MAGKRPPRSPWHPLLWPTWLGLGFFYLLNLLPWAIKRPLGRLLGVCIYYLVPVRRRVVATNLRLAFPHLSAASRATLARRHYVSLGLGLFETIAAWWSPPSRLPRHRIVGLHHLHTAATTGQGALVLTGHITMLELGARILNDQLDFGALFRDPNNEAVAQVMRGSRERQLKQAIHFDDLRGLLRALKQGSLIWYAPDQGKKTKMSELLPFFGEPAITNVATSRIAQMTGCQVIPYFARREPNGEYLLEIFPPWTNFPSGDHTADALRVNHFIEEQVCKAPEQYFWVHKRYKRRGEGLPDVYRK